MPGMLTTGDSAIARLSSPFLIGVGGGTASGKSTVCDEIMRKLGGEKQPSVVMISQDAFYRELSEDEKAKAFRGDFNFDHPDALDYNLMLETLQDLKQGKPVSIFSYDFRTHSRVPKQQIQIGPVDVVLVEGILIFYYEPIRKMLDMKLFVEMDPDTRLARRVTRDIQERGRDLEQILHQYLNLVKPAYEEFCLPTKKYADVIIPRGAENQVAIELIVQHIQELLRAPRPTGNENARQISARYRNKSDSSFYSNPNRLH